MIYGNVNFRSSPWKWPKNLASIVVNRFIIPWPVWPDWAKICHFGKISKVCLFLWVYLEFGKILSLLWLLFYAFGQISLLTKAQYWKKYTVIWSHWSLPPLEKKIWGKKVIFQCHFVYLQNHYLQRPLERWIIWIKLLGILDTLPTLGT